MEKKRFLFLAISASAGAYFAFGDNLAFALTVFSILLIVKDFFDEFMMLQREIATKNMKYQAAVLNNFSAFIRVIVVSYNSYIDDLLKKE